MENYYRKSSKNWEYNKINDPELIETAKQININNLIVKILMSRGYDSKEKIEGFLYGWQDCEYDPFLMKDMDKCVNEIKEAVEIKDKITVYGDYDCDGITAAAILTDFLKNIGANVDYYIPDRITEGYGLSRQAIKTILEKGTDLIITVDCGITAIEETKYINGMGKSIIITDHHQCQKNIPDAAAVLNPNRHDCGYPFKMLAGVGVAYKLIQALCKELNLGDTYKKYLELVTLGTVADVVSITGENKKIVSMGLNRIGKTENPGLYALVQAANLNKYKITANSFSFGLSPRINAAGRMGNAGLAIELILADGEDKAKELAALVEDSNKRRQEVEADNLKKVLEIINENKEILNKQIIIISSKEFYIGVIGIVAAKISEKYNKPCILLCEEEIIAKGSARSVEGINIYELLSRCNDLLLEFGGHALAAGIALETGNIEKLTDRMDEMIRKTRPVREDTGDIFQKTLKADIILDINEITVENIDSLKVMEPFGHGNEVPVFISENFTLKGVRELGTDGKHLRFTFFKNGTFAEAVAFNMGYRKNEAVIGNNYDIIYNLENNEWNNTVRPQIKLIDFEENILYG